MFALDHIDGIRLKGCELGTFDEARPLPLVVRPAAGQGGDLLALAAEQKDAIEQLLTRHGAILFRDFEVAAPATFDEFITRVSSDALFYSERSSPRHAVYKNIYTSTDHPQDKEIVQHSEQSYNKSFPRKIFFYCEKASPVGGATPLADARKIYRRLPEQIVATFESKHYRYSRCFWQVMGTTWQTAFQTEHKEQVEAYCQRNDIHFEWHPGEVLKTYQVRPTTAYHPLSGEACWFNHCTFFNLLSLDAETQEILSESFEPDELPNQTFYGDGQGIAADVIQELQRAYAEERTEFQWQPGDVLMIDNILVTHGRRSYQGERSILCGMSDITHWADVAAKPAA
ncbi:TauD/TfdA family dioxygenase [Lysobacter enzymogenes]|uniref:TauD/TfdA family dioxygenase n=1 Tax=Lysobacter enzymogenes TaxID=69 RepID=UPI001A95DE6A|nr:TauD/TfdA family dioxygenase [Lysobacter enzymogenes]QQP97286.1 TauD/TfdA family dioxygenase [Lysobacter enzymogenes]